MSILSAKSDRIKGGVYLNIGVRINQQRNSSLSKTLLSMTIDEVFSEVLQ